MLGKKVRQLFVIGESRNNVNVTKLELPKEYNLRKKNRKIYGVWVGDKFLYLSDELDSIKSKAGKDGQVFEPYIDVTNRITVPSQLDSKKAIIRGLISAIEIEFLE